MTSYRRSNRATSASGSNPSSPQNKKGCVDGGPIGKKPRIGKMVGASAGVMTSQAFAVVNGSSPDLPQTASVAGSDCGATIEFSKKAVEALLNETMKMSGLKEEWEQKDNYIKRLQLCIKWFLELKGNYMEEKEKLQTASVAGSDCGAIQYSKEAVEALLNEKMKKPSGLEDKEPWRQRTDYIVRLRLCIQWFLQLEERRCDEAELFMKNEEELIAIIMELRKKVAKEESDKLAVTNSLAREKEARLSAEKLQTSLSEEVAKCQRELQASNQKLSSLNEMYKRLQEYNTSVQQYNTSVQQHNTELQSALAAANDNLINHFKTSRLSSLNEMYKRLQEYTTSLQQYNTKLESELAAASDNLKRVEKEKAAVVENLSTARGHNKSLQDISGASS